MCGRINQNPNRLKKLHPQEIPFLDNTVNIGVGQKALMLHAKGLSVVNFGFNRNGKFNFNSRAEGFMNKDNVLNYKGPFGIHTNPFVKDAFLNRRALIPVSSFIEGPEVEKLSKPFDISLKNTEAFYLACIFDADEKKDGEIGFSIITTYTNEIIKEQVGHHRSPVIIEAQNIDTFLNTDTYLNVVLDLLRPLSSDQFEIKPISPKFKSPAFHDSY